MHEVLRRPEDQYSVKRKGADWMEETVADPVAFASAALAGPNLEAGPPEPPGFDTSALESKALHATVWTVLSYGAGQGLRLVNSLILTRLLLPSAFGELQLVTAVIVGLTMLSDLGLGQSIVQSKRGDEPVFLNTAWTIQAIRGTAIWAIACLLAWPASRFYNDRTLMYVLPILALTSIIGSVSSSGLLSLERHMGVRRLFALEFSQQILALGVTVGFAYFIRPNVWALVVGNIVANIYRTVASHHKRVVPGVRNQFCLDRKSVREIVGFGKWIFVGTAFFFFATQSDKLILGKCISMTELGLYGLAFQISDVPRSIINAFSNRVGYPFVSKIIHLPLPEFRRQYLRCRLYVLLLGAFLLSAMVIWGNLVILKLYPARYADAAWMIPILALGLWQTLLYTTTMPVLFSLGKSSYNATGNAAYCVAMLVGIPIGFHFFGLRGAVVAVAAGDFPLYLVTQYGAVRERIRPLAQDLQLTGAFLGFLGIDFALRRMF
jgi:O-antigen/teichoic acid export membrane protein